MRFSRYSILLFILLALVCSAADAATQTSPAPSYFHSLFVRPSSPTQVPGPKNLQEYVSGNRLRLGLRDAIKLALLNDTDVRLNELQLQLVSLGVNRARGQFDPIFTSSFAPTRSNTPATSTLDSGSSTFSQLTHRATLGYSQLFATGTSYSISFNGNRSATNSQYSFLNPAYNSSLSFNLSQPLLRKRGIGITRAPIIIAQRTVKQSRATFQAQMSDSIAKVVGQYWDALQSRKDLEVVRKSLELAETTYKQNKRALELGALPPLDIYRSEAQVAQRKLALIQAEYRLKQVEDELRRTLGADLDSDINALDLDLTENVESAGEFAVVDAHESLQRALVNRPELEALRVQIANDETNIDVANNNLKPDLSLNGFYTTNGTGGNYIDRETGEVVTHGGFGDSWHQLTRFDYATYGVTLQLRLPLRNRAASADLGSALISKRKSLYLLRQREQAIRLEVKNAVNQLEQAKLSIAAAKVSRDVAQKNMEAEQRKFELGAQTIFFVLDAQTQLAQAEQDLAHSQIGYQRALTALDRACGLLLTTHQVEIEN
ncbi:MAG TPA: TolC family protein [Terriglobales bacterium]|nr:TolC family protein [Terriglobales bacterium]